MAHQYTDELQEQGYPIEYQYQHQAPPNQLTLLHCTGPDRTGVTATTRELFMDHQNSLAKWNVEETESGQARRGLRPFPTLNHSAFTTGIIIVHAYSFLVNLDRLYLEFSFTVFLSEVWIHLLLHFHIHLPHSFVTLTGAHFASRIQDAVQVFCRNKPDSLCWSEVCRWRGR